MPQWPQDRRHLELCERAGGDPDRGRGRGRGDGRGQAPASPLLDGRLYRRPMRIAGWRYPWWSIWPALRSPTRTARSVSATTRPAAWGTATRSRSRTASSCSGIVSRDTAAARRSSPRPAMASPGRLDRRGSRSRSTSSRPEGPGQRPRVHRSVERRPPRESRGDQLRGPGRRRGDDRPGAAAA